MSGECEACGDKLIGHEDESATRCRWCVTGWKPSREDKGAATVIPDKASEVQS